MNEEKRRKIKKACDYLLILLIIPTVVVLCMFFLQAKMYYISAIIVAISASVPILFSYEKKKVNTRELVVISVLVALCVAGRALFAVVPGFKPVTALVVIVGIYYGAQTGFLTGALSAVVSNIFFGQGVWTPLQMFLWGIIGFIAGLVGQKAVRWWALTLIGILAGVLYSILIDIGMLMNNSEVSWALVRATMISSLPFMAIYAISNVIFLLLLTKPLGKKLERLKTKYGIFEAF